MPRLSDFQQRFDEIKRGQYYGNRVTDIKPTDHTRVFLLNQLLVEMEKAYDAVPLHNKKMQQTDPAAFELYMEIRDARYPKEVVKA